MLYQLPAIANNVELNHWSASLIGKDMGVGGDFPKTQSKYDPVHYGCMGYEKEVADLSAGGKSARIPLHSKPS
jgi:hypothetical protein